MAVILYHFYCRITPATRAELLFWLIFRRKPNALPDSGKTL
jgi:hypothetical protein